MYFFLIAITPPPIVKVKCCLDPLNPPLPYARRSSASAVAFSSSERRGLPSRTLSNDLRISATAAGTFALAVALSAPTLPKIWDMAATLILAALLPYW
jgi:hypothetical protein